MLRVEAEHLSHLLAHDLRNPIAGTLAAIQYHALRELRLRQ